MSADAVIFPGSITIIKAASPEGSTSFPFTASPAPLSSFNLVDDGTATSTMVFSNITSFTTYTITEGTVANWSLDSIVCTVTSPNSGSQTTNLGTRTATISLKEGENVTCTFSNTQQTGTITVVKETIPDGSTQSFTFTPSWGSSFNLTDGGSQSSGPIPPGTYSVAETVPDGWDLTSAVCSDGSPVNAISLQVGENVTCTFSNTQRGSITVIKDAVPDDAQDFAFTTTGDGLSGFSLDDDADGTLPNTTTFSNLAPGAYTVTEAVVDGWDLTVLACSDGTTDLATRTASITLGAGENVTCTFTNTKRGKIIVVKETDPASAQTFEFDPSWDEPNFTLTDGGTHESPLLVPGTYSVAEVNVPDGWDMTGATCDDGSPIDAIDLAAGETVTCTFTNTQNGTLVIKKETTPDGDPAEFTFDPDWSDTNVTLADGGEQSFSLAPATYSVAELAAEGWDLTGLVCDDGSTQDPATMTATVDLGAGETVTCTFTNTKRAKILVDKVTNPSGDTTAFEFDPSWGDNFFLAGGDPLHDSGWLEPGTYSVTELVPAGWALTGLTCDDGTTSTTATASITLAPGDVVTCTFTNSKRGSITVVKDANPDGPTAFDFTGSDNLVDDPDNDVYTFTLTDDGTAANTRTFSNLAPGAYSISEIIPDGWDLSGPVCTVANANGGTQVVNGAQASINLAAGEDVTCTFTNTLRRGTIVIEKQTLPDGSGATFDFTASYDGDGFSLSDGQTNNSGPLLPGTYTVAEVVPDGWDLTGLSCVETGTANSSTALGTATASITLDPGETVTCTFTNTQRGSITIVKDANPNSDQSFGFTGDLGSFSLTADGTNPNSTTFPNLLPGTFVVTESALTGWDLTGLTCSDESGTDVATRTASIALDPGENVTCTFTNTQRGQIIVDKVTAPAGSQAIFTFDPSWGDTFTLTDASEPFNSGWLAPGPYTVEELALAGWDLTGLTCDDDDTTQDLADAVASVTLDPGEIIHCTFTNTQRQGLTISKTVTASYDRTYKWAIDKSVDQDPASATIASGSATFNYNVTVTPDGYTDSGWVLEGQITVGNPNIFEVTGIVVTDVWNDDVACTVTGGSNVTIPAGGSVVLDYACDLTSVPEEDYTGTSNVAFVVTPGNPYSLPDIAVSDTKPVTFALDQEIDKTITVVDDKVNLATPVQLGTWNWADGAHTFEYDLDLPGVAGVCTDYTNTATIVETEQSDQQTVTVCMVQAPTVSKTAVESYTTTYTWDITKSVDTTRQEIAAGGTATFDYSVEVSHDAGTNSVYQVSGTISVTNPNQFAAMNGVVVTDDILNDEGDSCVVAAGPTTIAAGATETYTYTCTWTMAPADTGTQTNRATVTWTPIDGETASASYDADVVWSEATVTLVDESIAVSDSLEGALGTVTVGVDANPTTFTYDQTFAGVSGTCTDYPNTATFTTNDSGASESDDETVEVCVGADLTVEKTASGSYNREYLWDISKTAVDDQKEIADGGTATFDYSVTVTQTGVDDSGWVVSGNITVTNPNDWQAITADVTDAIGPGWSCTVTGGDDVVVAASDSAILGYECAWTGDGDPSYSGTNSATATWDAAAAHTPTGTASGSASFTLSGAGATNKTVTVTDSLADPTTLGTVTATDPPADPATATFTYSIPFSGDPAGTCTTHDNTATITETGDSATETVTVCVGADLTVTKDATATYDRLYNWLIDKSVDGADSQTIASGSATFDYIVDVTPDGYDDSNWQITGTITVSNPNDWQAITAVVTDAYEGATCTVTGGAVTVPAATAAGPGTATATYTCDFATAPPYTGTNTATAQWNAETYFTPTGSATGTAAVDFGDPANETNRTIVVTDSEYGALGTSDFYTGPFQYTYSLDWEGTPGQCTTHDNTATITETGQSDSATVEVCMAEALGVTKTASPALTRTWAWDIEKLVDQTRQDIPLGGSATFNYTVNVTHDAGTDSAWVVSGTITVTNPNDFAPVTGVSVSDAIVDEPNASCVVTGGTDTIAAGESATFDYVCTYSAAPAASAQTNRATVTWTSLGAGETSASYDFPFNWTSPAVTLVDESVTVTDTLGGTLGTVSYTDDSPTTFTYPSTFTPTAASACTTYDNTATYTVVDDANDTGATDDASQSVQVCTAADLTVSKTANPAYHRTVTWTIDKDVDQTRVEIADDETATFNYTVGVTKTVVQSAWVITGTITVSNPNLWAVEVDISDATPGGSCTVTGGENVSVPAATAAGPGTATATYECTFASNPGSGTNSATATWDAAAAHTPTGSASGTATYDFASATTTTDGYDTITVGDTNQDGTESFSDSGTWQYAVVRDGVVGECTTYDNTATITQTGQEADASVEVCVGADLSVGKTATGTFNRTYTWDVTKTVDTNSQNVPAGTDATFNYGVTATQTGIVDSGWVVSGQIVVSNLNKWQDIVADVSDSVDNGGVCTMSIGGTPTDGQDLTIPMDGSVVIDYTCSYASDPTSYGGTNTATATWDAELYNTPTGTATGTADFDLTQVGATNKTVSVYDDKTDPSNPVLLGPLTGTDEEPFASQTWNYALDLPGVAGTCADYTNTAAVKSGETTLDSAQQTVEVCAGAALTVSKTASGTYDRQYLWEITKTVDTTSQTVPAGSDATFNYGVTATQTGVRDSGWVVGGQITVTNPNDFQSVTVDITDAIGEGWSCMVTGGDDVVVPAATEAGPGSATVDYSCTWQGAGQPDYSGTNTATATWDAASAAGGSASGTADFTLTRDQETNKTVDVYDDKTDPANPVLLGPLTGKDAAPFASQLFSYTLDLTSESGTCTEYTNTAWITSGEETLDAASQTVEVCAAADLSVTKTATTAFVRTHTWAIDKTADPTELSLFAGGSAAVDYTVAVDKTTIDSAWVVSGQITVSNPNRFQAVVVDVTDTIPNGGVCSVVGGSDATVPAATPAGPGTLTLAYTCSYAAAPDPVSGTNTATATWDAEEYGTPTGSASGTATADFSQATITTVGSAAVTVTDTNGAAWGPVTADTTWTYTETLACSRDVSLYAGDGHYAFTHPNTATIDETGADADALVTVDCYAPQVSKTAQTRSTRTWAWTIEKTADVSSLSLGFWQTGTISYTVMVSGTPADSAFAVSGVITVTNPNPDAAMTVALTDLVSGGIAATITADADCAFSNGTLTIPAGGTATCPYTAALPDGASRTNTATATLNGLTFTGSAAVTFGAPTSVIDETVSVTDDQVGVLGTVTGTGSAATRTWTYQKQVGPYAACTRLAFVNTATFVATDTGATGSDSWTVDVVVRCEAVCDCTRTTSYWLQVSDPNGRRGYDRTWDLIGPQGSSTVFFQSPYTYKTVLMLWPSGSQAVYYTLAQQYIAAELNLLQGATAPQAVVDAMYRAKAIFQQYTPAQVGAMTSEQKAELQSLATTLYRYNMGYIGPGRCR